MLYNKLYHFIFTTVEKVSTGETFHYISDEIDVKNNCVYDGNDINNLFDMFYPVGSQEKLPTVFVVHGGGYIAGHKRQTIAYSNILAEQGYCVINMEYTKCDGKEKKYFDNIISEFYKMFNYIKNNEELSSHIDFDRIFLAGDSAGAHVVSAIANIQVEKNFQQYRDDDLSVKGLILISPFFGPNNTKNFATNFGMQKIVYGNDKKNPINDTSLKYLSFKFPPTVVFGLKNDFVAKLHEEKLYKLAMTKNIPLKYYLVRSGFKIFHNSIVKYPYYYKESIKKITEFMEQVDRMNQTERELLYEKMPKEKYLSSRDKLHPYDKVEY